MTLPTWEIVCLTIAVVILSAASIYFFIRCWRSINAVNKKSSGKEVGTPHRQRKGGHVPDMSITQVYGVPYPSPTPAVPQPLDPARLDAMVMQGTSDLHPRYLEFKDGLGEFNPDLINTSLDYRVAWNGESALLESEFAPSMTESPVVDMNKDSSVVMGELPKMKKIVHINYDRGTDGAPEIHDITTDTMATDSDTSGIIENCANNENVIKNSTPISTRSDDHREMAIADIEKGVAQLEQVTVQSTSEKTLLKAPGGRWVAFDEDTPTVVVHNEDGFICQRLEFDS